jgi:hypothetical protein
MSNLRTKLLGLAAVATAFVSVSYGQVVTCTATSTEVLPSAAVYPGGLIAFANPTLRAEGETELVADVQVSGCTSTVATTGAVFVNLSPLSVTSKSISANGYLGNSDATLNVIQGGAVVQTVPGVVSASQVSFTGINFTVAAFTLEISNVRVNATGAAAPQVTESVDIQYASNGLSTNYNPATIGAGTGVSNGAYQVGYVLASLGANSLLPNPVFTFNSYTVCAGNTLPFGGGAPTATNLSFTVNIKELVGGAFKTQAQENGSYVPAGANANGIGLASSTDQLQVTLGNVPASATVYVPQSLTVTGTTIAIANTTAVTSPAGIVALGVNEVAFTPSNGTITIPYSVTAAASTGAGTFEVPVYVIFAANSAAAQGAMTVAQAYAPAAVVTGPATSIPTFAVSTATPLSASSITVCQTTLLFPYVTNATGFETGIAIANTTTDNLKTFPVPGSQSTPTNGTCTLNFYGNLAQPTATVTPTMGAYTAAAPTVVPIYANILTSMVGSSGFSGYAIASCNFLEAHGFAFITDTTGTFSGTEGYLGVVIPNTRGEVLGNGN